MKKKISVVMCLVLIVSMMTGCTTFNNFKNAFFSDDSGTTKVENSGKTIKIGVYEPLSGAYRSAGNEEKLGIELAHELYPEVLGRKIELIYGDNQGDMYVAETVINELVAQEPAVILGSYGETVTLVAGDAVKEAQIPSIRLTGTNPLITVNNPYYFSATFSETKQGYALADYIYKGCNKKKVAVVRVSGDDTVVATVQRFNNKMRNLTNNSKCIVGTYQIDMEATDFSETIQKIKESKAEAVFLAVSPSKAKDFLEQAKSAKLTDILFVGTKDWNDKNFLEYIANEKVFDIAYTSDYATEATVTKMSETFLEAYRAKYGKNSEPTEAMAIAFDGYIMARAAIENAYNEIMNVDFDNLDNNITDEKAEYLKTNWIETLQKGIPTGELIKDALTKLKNFEGASGMISFNGSNEANKTIVVNRNTKGEVQTPFTEEYNEVVSGATDSNKSDKDVAIEAKE